MASSSSCLRVGRAGAVQTDAPLPTLSQVRAGINASYSDARTQGIFRGSSSTPFPPRSVVAPFRDVARRVSCLLGARDSIVSCSCDPRPWNACAPVHVSARPRDRCSTGAVRRAECARKCVPQLGNMMQMMSKHVGCLEEVVCMMNTSPHATSGSVRLQKMGIACTVASRERRSQVLITDPIL
jgi:hypothetical protein